MLEHTFFKTINDNEYVYSFNKNYILNSNALLRRFIQRDCKIPIDHFEEKIIKEGEFSLEEIAHYKQKYEFLKKTLFFKRAFWTLQ